MRRLSRPRTVVYGPASSPLEARTVEQSHISLDTPARGRLTTAELHRFDSGRGGFHDRCRTAAGLISARCPRDDRALTTSASRSCRRVACCRASQRTKRPAPRLDCLARPPGHHKAACDVRTPRVRPGKVGCCVDGPTVRTSAHAALRCGKDSLGPEGSVDGTLRKEDCTPLPPGVRPRARRRVRRPPPAWPGWRASQLGPARSRQVVFEEPQKRRHDHRAFRLGR